MEQPFPKIMDKDSNQPPFTTEACPSFQPQSTNRQPTMLSIQVTFLTISAFPHNPNPICF